MTARALWLAGRADADVELAVQPGCVAFTAEEEAETAQYWEQRCAANAPASLFDGPVWMARDWRVVEGAGDGRARLVIEAQLSSYKYMLNVHFNPRARVAGPSRTSAKALGASAVTLTSDGFVLLGLRSGQVATTPHTWHLVPAGNVDRPDLADLMAAELREELGGSEDADWEKLSLLGLLDAGAEQGHKTEIVFIIQLRQTLAQVKEVFKSNAHDLEHDLIEGFPSLDSTAHLNLTQVATCALAAFFKD